MLKINVNGAEAVVTEKEILTAGRAGLKCSFNFSSEWAGLTKVAVFEGKEAKDVAMSGNVVTIPPEPLADDGYILRIGVYGLNAEEEEVIPTVWVRAGKILPAVETVDPNLQLTPSVAAECIDKANRALEAALDVQNRAENHEFDGAPYELTAADKESIAQSVIAWLIENNYIEPPEEEEP